MSDEKTKTDKSKGQQPVTVIRNGAIAASIWKRQTSTGFEYLDFSLSRSWKLKSGEKEGYSSNFFPGNEEAIRRAVTTLRTFLPDLDAMAFVGGLPYERIEDRSMILDGLRAVL